jgi:hypothetical protein
MSTQLIASTSDTFGDPGRFLNKTSTRQESLLMIIVRRALRQEANTCRLTKRVHATARRLKGGAEDHCHNEPEALVRRIARELAQTHLRRP